MGIPMYKDPDDEQTIKGAAAKLDRAAATRRSTIRREPTVRLRESPTAPQGLARLTRDLRRGTSASQDRNDARIAELQAELESLRRTRLEIVEGLERTSRHPPQHPDLLDTEPEPQPESINGNEGQDSGAENIVEPADVIRAHLPRPPRESNLRFELSGSSDVSWLQNVRTSRTIPSPPYSSGSAEYRDRSIPDGPLLDDNSMPALTEGFAPARVVFAGSDRGTSLDDEIQLETPPPETVRELNHYPPLRRVNHMSPRPLPRVDGLGDRRRSPSPLSDTHEEDTWATILTEMNTERGSTSTSFASTIPESRNRSGRGLQNLSTSFGEIGSMEDTCDLDLPEGITEQDAQELRARHRPRDVERMTGRRGLQEHHERIASRVIRAIQDRMHREDIPDDWWAAIGLPSDIRRT